MTLCFPTIRQILRLPIRNGKVLCSPDSLHVMMILRKRKTYTVVLTGVQLSRLQPLILVSVYGLFLQVWAYGTVLIPLYLMMRRLQRMMKDLNANMTTLNIKHAGMLIHELG